MLCASQSYDVTCIWWTAVLAAVVLPPLLVIFYRRGWKISTREMFLALAVVSAAIACMASEIQSLMWIRYDPQPSVQPPGDWWMIPAALLISSLFMLLLNESRR